MINNIDLGRFGIILGPLVLIIMLLLSPPEGLSQEGWYAAAVTVFMGIWWITEAVPISVTALVPIVLFPLLGVQAIAATTAPYANPLIFLFLGGFILAIAMEKWDLHRRVALVIVSRVGVAPKSIILGFIVAAAFLSMWVSNTATAIMMLPIALSILALIDRGAENSESSDLKSTKEKTNFELALILSIAYACNIGGMGTLIGTPPNALLAAFMLENYGIEIGFLEWMKVGVPLLLVSIPLLYFVLTRWIYPIRITEIPGGKGLIARELDQLGKMTNQEKKVGSLFVSAALLWMFRPALVPYLPGLSDAGIAIAIGVALFLVPAGKQRNDSVDSSVDIDLETPVDPSANNDEQGGNYEGILEWKDAQRLPWGILLLFGGGLSMASAISSTGLAAWIGSGIGGLQNWPIVLLVVIVIALMIFLTEMTSNTASTATFLPILASIAIGLGENPLLFAIPTVLAASCAFMLPVATPPNAIVYGSGRITIPEMSRAGLLLNLLFIALLSLGALTFFGFVFGVEIGVLPEWANR
ncbi:MAG: SLC13 family permease [Bacteroidetes bacterium]|nr:SLC13 family permease [Bacteroidota bacterium]